MPTARREDLIANGPAGRTALLYLDQNGGGDLDPHAEFSDTETDLHTEEDRGTSFRQLLCIAFDLAVPISYAKEPFFHFVYHDGGLERLQNKLKLTLLRIILETCTTYGIQYLFSALSEDLPTQEDTENLCPTPEEIFRGRRTSNCAWDFERDGSKRDYS